MRVKKTMSGQARLLVQNAEEFVPEEEVAHTLYEKEEDFGATFMKGTVLFLSAAGKQDSTRRGRNSPRQVGTLANRGTSEEMPLELLKKREPEY